MNPLSSYTDSLAIGLSALCLIHCLASPVLLILLPSLTALQLDNEAFHGWLLLAVIPTSLFSLLMGCKKHKFHQVLLIGFFGLVFLVLAVLVEGFDNGELLEKVFTVIGSCIVALGHFLNFRLCRKQNQCDCERAHGA